ncbi:DUF411 domain-containing protein [Aliifodinibius sp. S!AR15-10]|uniref:DUF411 domain-containing protein n=1 Tax=Aliifodinibius sp. S!AR15-10 TaxID=2950437 RepID=UPI002862F2F2|nr:DUF411 domain-containing protein [Aliifodinibius sp. S!AR15-10]MDR8391209.1 DUF411 domain-containing protein [Aliifodinibius sp. S!AR15-10]
MNKRFFLTKFLSIIVLATGITACSGSKSESGTEITMYKNPGCQCCAKWADYLEANGFEVTEEASPNMQAIKSQNNVPYDMGSCHTAVIGDYVVEGHVPVEDIKNLIEEQPDAKGLAVPGMPIGSPGMEMPGRPAEAYKVFLFQEDGSRQVYAQH